MCGEHTGAGFNVSGKTGSSPHVRGALSAQPVFHGADGDHPRMCGEHYTSVMPTLDEWGSSPHVRGARVGLVSRFDEDGIIPACAGSTLRK